MKKKPKSKLSKAIEETRKDMIALELLEESQNVEDIIDDFNPKTWICDWGFIKEFEESNWHNIKDIRSIHIDPCGDEFQVSIIFSDSHGVHITKPTKFYQAARNELMSILECLYAHEHQ